jgi:hypothetical protein
MKKVRDEEEKKKTPFVAHTQKELPFFPFPFLHTHACPKIKRKNTEDNSYSSI